MSATKALAPPQDKIIITIKPPNMRHVVLKLIGEARYVQLRFSEKAKAQMRDKMLLGEQAKKNRKREPRDFDADFRAAFYKSTEGWYGIPASAFRNALVSACRIVGFVMAKAKLSLFIEADGFDAQDGTPLVRITGTPEKTEDHVRNASGVCDIRVRAKWRQWGVDALRIRYDADQFSETDVVNLMHRVGCQVGIGEGRPDSKDSCGQGWGLFSLASS
jgi:hypothetical protein